MLFLRVRVHMHVAVYHSNRQQPKAQGVSQGYRTRGERGAAFRARNRSCYGVTSLSTGRAGVRCNVLQDDNWDSVSDYGKRFRSDMLGLRFLGLNEACLRGFAPLLFMTMTHSIPPPLADCSCSKRLSKRLALLVCPSVSSL